MSLQSRLRRILRLGSGYVRERRVGFDAGVGGCAKYRDVRGRYRNRNLWELGDTFGLCDFGRRGIAAWKE